MINATSNKTETQPESLANPPNDTPNTNPTKPTEEDPEKSYKESLQTSISITLLKVITNNKSKEKYKEITKKQKNSLFNSKNLPTISLSDYLNRINKYTNLEYPTLVVALIFIDRLCKKKKILLTEYNTYRILFTSILISIKYNEDKYYSNLYYAKVGGIELKLLNDLEQEFLSLIGFELYVEKKLFEKYIGMLLGN